MKYALSLLALLLCSCADLTNPQLGYYQSDISPQERARNRTLVNQVEDESYHFDQRERMGVARAVEMATRHAPSHVTTQSTNVHVW